MTKQFAAQFRPGLCVGAQLKTSVSVSSGWWEGRSSRSWAGQERRLSGAARQGSAGSVVWLVRELGSNITQYGGDLLLTKFYYESLKV